MNFIYMVLWVLAILVTWYGAIVFVDFTIEKDLKMYREKARNYKYIKPLLIITPMITIFTAVSFSIFCFFKITMLFI